jgi:hypothetical protein
MAEENVILVTFEEESKAYQAANVLKEWYQIGIKRCSSSPCRHCRSFLAGQFAMAGSSNAGRPRTLRTNKCRAA